MIYICIPARDEEKTLGPLLWRIRSVFTDPEFQRDFRILVADDGSSDRTPQVLERYKTAVPLEVFNWPQRRGYAATLEGLLREAVDRSRYPKRDLVVTLQADLTEHPDHLVPLVKAAEGGADLVGCAMDGGLDALPSQVRWGRRLAPHLARRIFKGAPITDPVRSLRAYRVVVLRKAFREAGDGPMLREDGWAANVELLKAVTPHARRVAEVPVPMRYDLLHRESRFRVGPALKGLFRVRRGIAWS
ncbi:MAG: glycosyltransferase family 2 protein [Gemmatimonadota bacterium]